MAFFGIFGVIVVLLLIVHGRFAERSTAFETISSKREKSVSILLRIKTNAPTH